MKRAVFAVLFIVLSSAVSADSISFEIYSYLDSSEGVLIAEGIREYAPADIVVTEKAYRGEVHWEKYLEVEGGFRVGASIYREAEVTGFGIWAKSTPCSFSWEWFKLSGPRIFSKLQEQGQVSVEYREVGGLKEIAAIHFDTDISLRLNETKNEVGAVTYRVLMKKGSVLKFSPGNVIHKDAKPYTPLRLCRL